VLHVRDVGMLVRARRRSERVLEHERLVGRWQRGREVERDGTHDGVSSSIVGGGGGHQRVDL